MSLMDITEEPRFPCETCGKQKSRVWVPIKGGNSTLGWACHWCLDTRTGDLCAKLAAAEAKLVHAADAVSFYDDINDGVAIVAAVREALGLPPLGMRR